MQNLVLIGFMGTGKTTVGKQAAKELGMDFVDTDKEIEIITGMTVKEIFDEYGELRFRSEEQAAVRRLAQEDNRVIATGGGVVLNPDNLKNLRANGVIVALTAEPEVIYERVHRKKTRPLLDGDEDPMVTIRRLMAEREGLYRQADDMVDTSRLSLQQVRDEVIRIYREQLAKKQSVIK